MLMELTRKSVRVLADFRVELTVKSDGSILLGTNMQIRTSRKNQHAKSAQVSSYQLQETNTHTRMRYTVFTRATQCCLS